jgi:hypothetical protein
MNEKENLLRVIRHDSPEWVPNGMSCVATFGPPVIERPGDARLDDWGVKWDLEDAAQGGTYPAPGGHTVTDLSKWKNQVHIPDVDTMDWDSLVCSRTQEGERVDPQSIIDRDVQLACGFVEFGVFERSYLLLGMEEALASYVTEPELMNEMAGAIADYKIRLIERFDDLVDLDMIWYGDDWGMQDNLLVPVETWRSIIKPHTKRIYDCLKDRNIIINQHSCGKIEAVFGDMVEIGADIWNPCQPCNDLAALKKSFSGRISFCGGIDSQFVLDRPGVTPDEVRAEVRKRIDELAQDGGYIAGPSHGVPYDRELIDAMNDEIAVYGRAFYAGSN